MKNLTVHILLRRMIIILPILTTSLLQCFSKVERMYFLTLLSVATPVIMYWTSNSSGARCYGPVGLGNRRLPNRALTASSMWDARHAPAFARLNLKRTRANMGAWSAAANNRYQWLQIDFGRFTKVKKIATQGRQDASQWVTRYKLSHSINGARFSYYYSKGRIRVSFSFILHNGMQSVAIWTGFVFPIKSHPTKCWVGPWSNDGKNNNMEPSHLFYAEHPSVQLCVNAPHLSMCVYFYFCCCCCCFM